jgi:hypothetical protein
MAMEWNGGNPTILPSMPNVMTCGGGNGGISNNQHVEAICERSRIGAGGPDAPNNFAGGIGADRRRKY